VHRGSRSYGIGLARALAAAGLLVIECEQPSRKQRRGKGKSDAIDAHLAALAALRLDTGRRLRRRMRRSDQSRLAVGPARACAAGSGPRGRRCWRPSR
jgi:hypothetical protein